MIHVQTEEEEVAVDYMAYHVWLHDQLLLTLTCNTEGDLIEGWVSVTHGFAMGAVEECCQHILDEIEADDGIAIRSQGFDGRAIFAQAVRDLGEPDIEPDECLRHPVEVGL